MSEKHTNQCLCENAVRYTYFSLMAKDHTSSDALQSAYEVLKHHHPEIPQEEISSKVASILLTT